MEVLATFGILWVATSHQVRLQFSAAWRPQPAVLTWLAFLENWMMQRKRSNNGRKPGTRSNRSGLSVIFQYVVHNSELYFFYRQFIILFSGLWSLPERCSWCKGTSKDGRSRATAGRAEVGGNRTEAERAPRGLWRALSRPRNTCST